MNDDKAGLILNAIGLAAVELLGKHMLITTIFWLISLSTTVAKRERNREGGEQGCGGAGQ